MEELVIRAQNGDKQAFCLLIQSVKASLYRTARAFLKKESDCSDAIQETILKAYESIERLKKPAYFKTWITRILINQCKKMLLKQKKMVSLEEYDKVPVSHSKEFEKIEVRELLDHLEESHRIVISLYYFEKYPLHEIAQILQIPEGTVKSRLFRARQNLEELMTRGRKLVVFGE